MSTQPKGLARAALEREGAAAGKHGQLQGHARVTMSIAHVELEDGRVRLVDRGSGQMLGVAVDGHQANRTRDFFR